MESATFDTLTFEQLRIKNVCRCNQVYHPVNERRPIEWFVALMGEMGEVGQLLYRQHTGIKHDAALFQQRIADELADVQIYHDLLANSLYIDLGKATRDKFNRTSHAKNSDILLLPESP